MNLTVDLDDAVVEQLADRVLERATAKLAERQAPADDGWLRGASAIARYIDAPPSRVYALHSAGRIPLERDGSALLAHKPVLDAWIRAGGGKRT